MTNLLPSGNGPIVVYLDTQDFAHLYRDDISEQFAEVKRKLLKFKSERLVSFPLSFLSLFEFVQDYQTEFEQDRAKRARFLSEICGTDTLPYFLDLAMPQKPVDYSTWLPYGAAKNFSVAHMLHIMKAEIKNRSGIPRDLRRKLQNSNFLKNFLRNEFRKRQGLNFEKTNWNPELPEFDFDFFRDYILGKISESAADNQFRETVFDPAKFFTIWYQRFSKPNPMSTVFLDQNEKFFQGCKRYHDAMQQSRLITKTLSKNYKSATSRIKTLNRQLAEFDLPSVEPPTKPNALPTFEELSAKPEWGVMFQKLKAPTAARLKAYAKGLYSGQFTPKRSDIVDIFHAVYIEHVDLWRGDKKFCDMLSRVEGQPHERIVGSLSDLPIRIERLL